MNWTSIENTWVMDISECTGFMPRGEPIPPLENWEIYRDSEGEIIHWAYTYPDGQIAILVND